MSNPHLIASIDKNCREELRVELTEFKGHQLIQLRVWAKNGDANSIPTKSGFGLRVSFIPTLRAVLADAEAKARALGWLEAAAEGDHCASTDWAGAGPFG